ncbi:MAG: Transcriptional regulator MntR [Phycisphaerae bacterium]|nr:Transcriptional regulator MntR [Phycisphaerae bacterium]
MPRPTNRASSTDARRRSAAPDAGRQADRHRRTRDAHARELAEDYVEVVAELIERTGEARAVDIARHIGVTHVTVIKTIERLQRDGLVTTRPYRSIFLTDAGKRLADASRRRHQIVVNFLLSIGVSDAAAQADAEGIEHHVSPETLAALERVTRTRTP